jgi:hypothetical protein
MNSQEAMNRLPVTALVFLLSVCEIAPDLLSYLVSKWVCVCVCVRERERERTRLCVCWGGERVIERVCMRMHVCGGEGDIERLHV